MNQGAPRSPRPPVDASSGGGWKWLVAVFVLAVLIGGGYYAWRAFRPAAPSSELAYDSSAEPDESGLLSQDQDGSTQSAATDEEPVVSNEKQTASVAPARRRSAARAAPVPEEVIGVSPVTTTTEEAEEIVVPGVRRPVWTRRPSARRLSAAYPERALENGREGEASLRCTVREEGALDCMSVSETPAHAGFGRAALRVARMFRHGPRLADGSPAQGSPLNLRVIFRIADDDRRRRR
jgi:TonB family protein